MQIHAQLHGQLGLVREPEYVVLNSTDKPQLFDDQSGDSLELLGTDRGYSVGVARRLPLVDGSNLLLKPTFYGLVHLNVIHAMRSSYTRQGHSKFYGRKNSKRKLRMVNGSDLWTPC